MGPDLPSWEFIAQVDKTWTWRDRLGGTSVAGFDTLAAALEHATLYGFDRSAVYWVVRYDKRATHFRPGTPGRNEPGQ